MTQEYDLSNQRNAFLALERERQSLGISLEEMRDRSGVSTNSVYAWRSCVRSPSLLNMVKIADCFGFEVILRRKD